MELIDTMTPEQYAEEVYMEISGMLVELASPSNIDSIKLTARTLSIKAIQMQIDALAHVRDDFYYNEAKKFYQQAIEHLKQKL